MNSILGIIISLPILISSGQSNTWCPAHTPQLDGMGGSVGAVNFITYQLANGNCEANTPCVWQLEISVASFGALGVTGFQIGTDSYDLSNGSVTVHKTVKVDCEEAGLPPILFTDSQGTIIGFQRLFLLCSSCDEIDHIQ